MLTVQMWCNNFAIIDLALHSMHASYAASSALLDDGCVQIERVARFAACGG
jgi:hypothetical protein